MKICGIPRTSAMISRRMSAEIELKRLRAKSNFFRKERNELTGKRLSIVILEILDEVRIVHSAASRIPSSGSIVTGKAVEINQKVNDGPKFKASQGLFTIISLRMGMHSTTTVQSKREKLSTNSEMVSGKLCPPINKMEFCANQVCNCDETELYWIYFIVIMLTSVQISAQINTFERRTSTLIPYKTLYTAFKSPLLNPSP